MATLAADTSKFDYERDLQLLLETFGSVVPLEVIASAYCQSKWNVDKAGEILYEIQTGTLGDPNHVCKTELGVSSATYSAPAFHIVQDSNNLEIISKASKTKKMSASLGTVSSVIGKDYVSSKPSAIEPCKGTKPLLLDLTVPVSETWSEEDPSTNAVRNDVMKEDVEKFLFHMLGEGFQLDMKVIHDVLGICGYDVEKSMEKLLEFSAITLRRSDDILGRSTVKSTEKCLHSKSYLDQGNLHQADSTKRTGIFISAASERVSPKRVKAKYDMQREVLESLFNVPERLQDVPKTRPLREVRSRAFGKVVVEPVQDSIEEHPALTGDHEKLAETECEDDDSFQMQRKAVKEYWNTMKEYYKAAVDAFAKGDATRANKLLEQGHFHSRKAREADERSTQNLTENIECNKSDTVSLNLLDQEPKEAVRLLKLHLASLSGIPSIEYLKVIMGPDDANVGKASQKRLIIKLLERESIKWSEEQNGQVLLIRVDEINPKKLSFGKKE